MMLSLTYYYSVFTMMISSVPSIFDDVAFFGDGKSSYGADTMYTFPASRIAAANAIVNDEFPPDFLFGVSTSAFQIEGGWNVSDKTPSVWDDFTHKYPELISDHQNADIAADSYHKYKEDILLVKNLGANAYRISLSWTRILPDGFTNRISAAGVAYYNDLINEMLKHDIEPMITIFHWDLPKRFQDMGGWTNPFVVDWFVEYARVVFHLFGDRVKMWITINEPSIFCVGAYGGEYAPRIQQSGVADYLCGHHVLLAHAKAYRMYKTEFQRKQNGKVGIVMSLSWPVSDHPGTKQEVLDTEMYFQFWNGWFMNPVFGESGDYPEIMKTLIAANSAVQGFKKSRLPVFTSEDIEMIKQSADYLGVNFYMTTNVRRKAHDPMSISYYNDMGLERFSPRVQLYIHKSTPWALGKLLHKINLLYKIPMIYITENGYSDAGQLMDVGRAKYHHEHLSTLLDAMRFGVDIRGYFAWSLLDNFEWIRGYTRHYGLYKVDFNDPNRKRSAKLSTKIVSDIYKTRKIPKLSKSLGEIPFNI